MISRGDLTGQSKLPAPGRGEGLPTSCPWAQNPRPRLWSRESSLRLSSTIWPTRPGRPEGATQRCPANLAHRTPLPGHTRGRFVKAESYRSPQPGAARRRCLPLPPQLELVVCTQRYASCVASGAACCGVRRPACNALCVRRHARPQRIWGCSVPSRKHWKP